MIKAWLTNQVTVEQAEARSQGRSSRPDLPSVPFGVINARWEAFKSKMQPGDELWEFSSPPETWQRLAGRAGLCIVRDGEIIDSFVTLLN